MPYSFPPDIQERISERMARGAYQSEDDVLRDALQALDDAQEDLAAIQEAIAEWQAGDEGVPLEEAFDSLRQRRLP